MIQEKVELPIGWTNIPLGKVCEFIYGESLPQNVRREGKVPVYGSNGVIGYHDIPLTDAPTVVVGRKGSVGEVHYSKEKCWVIDTAYYVKPLIEINMEYLFYLLAHLNLGELNKSTAVPGLNREDVYKLEVVIPPFDEQGRIATRIRNQLAAVDNAKKATEEQILLLGKYLDTIVENSFSRSRFKDCKRVKLSDYTIKIGSGATPKGGQASYTKEGIALIRSQNVHYNRFEYSGLAFITEEQNAALGNSVVQQGDVLLNITGASIGRVCVVPDTICPANVNQHVCIIRPTKDLLPEFISFFIANPSFQAEILNLQSGATRQALTKEQIQNFDLPLISVEEQKSVLNGVINKLKQAREIGIKLNEQLSAITSLPTAILRKAYTGRI